MDAVAFCTWRMRVRKKQGLKEDNGQLKSRRYIWPSILSTTIIIPYCNTDRSKATRKSCRERYLQAYAHANKKCLTPESTRTPIHQREEPRARQNVGGCMHSTNTQKKKKKIWDEKVWELAQREEERKRQKEKETRRSSPGSFFCPPCICSLSVSCLYCIDPVKARLRLRLHKQHIRSVCFSIDKNFFYCISLHVSSLFLCSLVI